MSNKPTHWRVIGVFDGDAVSRSYTTTERDRAEAERLFRSDVYGEMDMSDEEIEKAEAKGEGVFIDYVLCSDSPIEEC